MTETQAFVRTLMKTLRHPPEVTLGLTLGMMDNLLTIQQPEALLEVFSTQKRNPLPKLKD
jgi:hypothetical protein